MEIEMNSRIGITACAMVLLLDEFGNELIEKIEQGTVAAYDTYKAFHDLSRLAHHALDKAVRELQTAKVVLK